MSKETEIKDNVFKKIRSGEVSMRSRLYFIVRVVLLLVLALIAAALAIFALSFAFFSIHESGEEFLLGFGQKGLNAFVSLFPWVSFVITIGLIVLLDHILRLFRFGYRVSMLKIFLVALAGVAVMSIAINFTPLHSVLLDSADHNHLPLIGEIYEEIHDSHQTQGVYRGVVVSIQDDGFVITHNDTDRDSDDGTWTIITPLGFATSSVQVGETMYVAGKLIQGGVHAYGVHPLNPDLR